MRNFDYHIHSDYSDGNHSINQIVATALERGVERIAITDHMSAFGHFLFSHTHPEKQIEEYLAEIARLRKKYHNKIEIYAGAEISANFLKNSKSTEKEDRLHDLLEYFSLFLIETYVIREPVLTALNMRKYLTELGYDHIPVILAHPSYSRMDFETFKLLIGNNIGFELNEDKLSERDMSFFIDHVNALTPQDKGNLVISLGSDSHRQEEVGLVQHSTQIIEENFLWKYVIYPPKVQDYLVI